MIPNNNIPNKPTSFQSKSSRKSQFMCVPLDLYRKRILIYGRYYIFQFHYNMIIYNKCTMSSFKSGIQFFEKSGKCCWRCSLDVFGRCYFCWCWYHSFLLLYPAHRTFLSWHWETCHHLNIKKGNRYDVAPAINCFLFQLYFCAPTPLA